MDSERKSNRSVMILTLIAGVLFITFVVLCVALVCSKSSDSPKKDALDGAQENVLSVLASDESGVDGIREKSDGFEYEDNNNIETYSSHVCSTCGGNGQIVTSTYVCPICGGTGWQWIPNLYYDGIMGWQGGNIGCSGCAGRGRTEYYGICPDCNGSGMTNY